ncbi:MAG: hypothetical protein O7A65_05110 [Proteobacteria bacterium]|nr:hypothetical protein [Pseudomonadota bacterium]
MTRTIFALAGNFAFVAALTAGLAVASASAGTPSLDAQKGPAVEDVFRGFNPRPETARGYNLEIHTARGYDLDATDRGFNPRDEIDRGYNPRPETARGFNLEIHTARGYRPNVQLT